MLYIYWNPSEVIFHIGSFGIRWYATCWLIGLLLGYLLMHRIYREEKIADEKFDPLFFHIFIGVLVECPSGPLPVLPARLFPVIGRPYDRDAHTHATHA